MININFFKGILFQVTTINWWLDKVTGSSWKRIGQVPNAGLQQPALETESQLCQLGHSLYCQSSQSLTVNADDSNQEQLGMAVKPGTSLRLVFLPVRPMPALKPTNQRFFTELSIS